MVIIVVVIDIVVSVDVVVVVVMPGSCCKLVALVVSEANRLCGGWSEHLQPHTSSHADE